EQAGMEIGALAHVLEDVAVLEEWRKPYPVDAFAAHLREAGRVTVHPGGHVVTPHAAQRAAAFGNAGRCTVGTARAEVGTPQENVARGRRRVLPVLRQIQADTLFQPCQDCGYRSRGRKLTRERHQLGSVAVALAMYGGAPCVIEENVLDLVFDHRSLLFHHEYVVEATR